MTLEQRSWGDGQAFSPEGVKFFLDHRRSWVKKFFRVAESSGCPRRERHLRTMMRLHRTHNREIAAWYALQEDLRLHHLYKEMDRMAAAKPNKRLFKDMTQTVHRSVILPESEAYAPDMYWRHRSRGFANDAAFDIIKAIADNWSSGLESDALTLRVCKAMDQLERQVQRSSTLKELKHNFFRVYNRSQKRRQSAVASE